MKIAGIILSCLFFLTSCTQPSLPPIKIALDQTWVGYLPMILAKEQGFFAQRGIQVELGVYQNGTETNHAYEVGEADGILSVFADNLMMNVRGVQMEAVYIIDYSNTSDMIVAKPQYQTLSELRGKTIAFDGINSFSHLFVIKALEKAGIREGDFRTVNLPMREVLPALEAGKIDAGYVYSPESNAAIAKGYKTLITARDMPGIITDTLAFSPEVIRQRSQEITKIIQALIMARDFMMQHPQQSLELLSKINGIASQELEIGFNGLTYPDLQQNIASLQPGGELFKSGAEIIDFYTQRGQIRKKPNLDNIINGKFVMTIP